MRKLLALALFLTSATIFAQGVTNSAINGRILDDTNKPLPGANVLAVHEPTGTEYGASTDFEGFYRIANMRPGGPYTITISFVSFESYVASDVFLQLGETQNISITLQTSANALDEVVVTARTNNIFNGNKTGSETTVSERDIKNLPAVSRSIADFARVTPQAQLTEGNDGFSLSFAGQNNRYNAIYIDGAVNNDVFGLAGSGTNGGQTGVNPFSVDAIETFQINLAPFDVRQSGFSGGSISAITRSGTNQFRGSVYGFLRNESFAGKTPPELAGDNGREKLSDFSAKTYGFRASGPIIEDKLFFFVNYERQDDETPQPFNFENYTGRSSLSDINDLTSFLQSEYGYDPGIFDNNTRTLESDKLTAKIDWNINDANKLSIRHSYVKGDNLEARNSNNRFLGFINGSEAFVTKTNSTSLELNTRFGNDYSNNLVLGYTAVSDDRDPSGAVFPTVDIQDGGGFISFGSEPFSTANLLDQKVLTLNDNFEIYKGNHTITLGTNLEYAKAKNLFFAFNFGDYTFEDQFDDDGNLVSSGLNQFLTMQNADVYQHGYSLVGDGTVGDESAGAAEFTTFQTGLYVQDEIQFSPSFKFTAGLRIDVPFWEDGVVNDDFNTRTVDLLEDFGKDLQGARVGKSIDPQIHWSPRVGFNWDINNESVTQVRGGVGIFTSRLPLVWPGGTYNNNGITGGFTFRTNQPFEPNVNQQFESPEPGSGGTGGNVDLIAEDFKLPQVAKFNVAVDQKLNFWGLIGTADFLYTKTIEDVYYENLNLKGPVGTLNGADNRPFYDRRDVIDDTYQGIYLISNTSEGYSYNTTFTLKKPFENGFQGQLSYAYGDSYKIFDGTSSQNSSQWRNIITVNGKNSDLDRRRSDFSLGSRITGHFSYAYSWNDNVETTIGLFYEGAQGQPFSFTYNEGRDLLNDDSRDNALIYVPASRGEINLIDLTDRSGNVTRTADEQYADLERFIEANEYLRERKGQYAEANGDRGPWNHVLDLKFIQDFSINIGNDKHTLQASVDIFNFTNLLNKDWGIRTFIPGQVAPLTTVSGGPDPAFTFDQRRFEDGIDIVDDSGLQSSRWQMQVGLRYLFN